MITLRERHERREFIPASHVPSFALSEAARRRLLARRCEPLLLADWMRVLMMHFEVDASELQRAVPYQLDLHNGRAFITLVAFSMENMHPRLGGKPGAWLLKPIAAHDFLNVRTYVRHNGEPGIHFLAEWLSSWLAVQLGPRTFGLPYRHGHISYEHNWQSGMLSGRVQDVRCGSCLEYRAEAVLGAPIERQRAGPEAGAPCVPCQRGSPDEWLMERYAAFNAVGKARNDSFVCGIRLGHNARLR
jgi:uncharacterized protein YqjF (DUF2071 family)